MHSPKCGSGNRPISKIGALELLREMLAPGTEGDALCRDLRISPAPDRLDMEFVGRSLCPGGSAPACGFGSGFHQ